MDKSLTNFELNESTLKTDSDQGSDKNSEETIDELVFNTGSSDSSLEVFDNNLPPTVTLLRHEETGSKVYLIGTAHFSRESQEDVTKVIKNVHPDIVVLELCDARTNILSWDEETLMREVKDMSFQKIMDNIRSNGVYNGVLYCLLLNATAQITKQTGMAPGGEFRVAFKEAKSIPHCKIQLGDRPFAITMKRALGTLSWFHYFKLGWHLLTSDNTITPEDIEKCKQRDILEQFLSEMAGEFPALRKVFLDERDTFLTHSLQAAASSKLRVAQEIIPGRSSTPTDHEPLKIVGVVGMGHVPGITRLWPNDQSPYMASILTVPAPSVASLAIRLTFRITIITIGSYLVYRYVPVPKTLIEYAHHSFHKMLKTGTSNMVKFTLH